MSTIDRDGDTVFDCPQVPKRLAEGSALDVHLTVVRDAGDGAFERLHRTVLLRTASCAAVSLISTWLSEGARERFREHDSFPGPRATR